KKAADKDKSEAWVVQVASVSDKAKADALSSKLAGKGYRSRVVKNGDTWKVVVGPELDKGKAQSLKSKLSGESALGVTGAWVAPWKP
ncbi:MAG TPA: SPOR domain-containing protein, partial [Agitococcus sp.]|nr:SPOR domain-containing protein [Agitococcus sp.]HNG46116.1 SPOR domain-containing protein [Agitococcus sp.]HNH42499.1 SPOR domain-containing protein [Agitococcus sp.]HNN29636.1 SPOR domain-containing protein [Agitococcus sp.]